MKIKPLMQKIMDAPDHFRPFELKWGKTLNFNFESDAFNHPDIRANKVHGVGCAKPWIPTESNQFTAPDRQAGFLEKWT
jgi:hypothetical protein